jgi:hypothetical protein
MEISMSDAPKILRRKKGDTNRHQPAVQTPEEEITIDIDMSTVARVSTSEYRGRRHMFNDNKGTRYHKPGKHRKGLTVGNTGKAADVVQKMRIYQLKLHSDQEVVLLPANGWLGLIHTPSGQKLKTRRIPQYARDTVEDMENWIRAWLGPIEFLNSEDRNRFTYVKHKTKEEYIEEAKARKEARKTQQLKGGQLVKIMDGPFKTFTGKVVSQKRDRLTVSVHILGMVTTVEIDVKDAKVEDEK